MKTTTYSFASELGVAINSGLSRSIILQGNTTDLFHFVNDEGPGEYVPLISWLTQHYSRVNGVIQIVAELNGPLRIYPESARETLKNMWVNWRNSMLEEVRDKFISVKLKDRFEEHLRESIKNSGMALEFLRQLTIASRQLKDKRLVIYLEAADMLVPSGDGNIARLSEADKHRIGVLTDWFMDMDFMNGNDTVVMITKSSSQIYPQITELPQVVQINVPSPNLESRTIFADWFQRTLPEKDQWGNVNPRPIWKPEVIGTQTGGLSTLAIRQLLVESGYRYPGQQIPTDLVVSKIEKYIISQTGQGTVEFRKPFYNLDKVVGLSKVKTFVREQLIPQCLATDGSALRAFLITGPSGAGKTFLAEGMAGEIGIPVMTIKSVRDQWFGGTDKKIQAVRQACEAVGKIMILVDEADTKFGKIGPNAHETEARLTGTFQEMMSDSRLDAIWCLMTSRPHNLSADMKREGRAGDLTFPILDPEPGSSDLKEFIRWVLSAMNPKYKETLDDEFYRDFYKVSVLPRIQKMSAAGFASLRSKTIKRKIKNVDDLIVLMNNIVEPDIAEDREYQTLQAMLHTTWIPLLPESQENINDRRMGWRKRVVELEMKGIR